MKCGSLIKLYAGKTLLSAKIVKRIPKHTTYIEPFVGGGTVFFKKDLADISILNDINPRFYRTYKAFQDNPNAIIRRLQGSLYGREFHKLSNYIYKNAESYGDLEVAWATMYAWATSYRNIVGDVFSARPCSGKRWSEDHLVYRNYVDSNPDKWAAKLKDVILSNVTAVECIRKYDSEGAFIYCDPPYIGTEIKDLGNYTEVEYRELLKTLSSIEGKFMLSCFDTEIIRTFTDKYGWKREEIVMKISLSRKGANKITKTELLITNY